MRTLVSPELVWTCYNVTVSLSCVLGNVTSMSLSRISSFKRSWELLTGVSTCRYDLSIIWSLKCNIWRISQTDVSLYWHKKFYNIGPRSPQSSKSSFSFSPSPSVYFLSNFFSLSLEQRRDCYRIFLSLSDLQSAKEKRQLKNRHLSRKTFAGRYFVFPPSLVS